MPQHTVTCIILALLPLLACRNDLADQPYERPMDKSLFFANHQSARPMIATTVEQGGVRGNDAYERGLTGGELVQRIPVPVNQELLALGQERYNIYCSPCHGMSGQGNGMIIQRGFSPPPSYHLPRLRAAPVGHLFNVITNGYGTMYSYGSRVPVAERWAIVAYIRALQLSRHATLQDIPESERARLQGGSQ